MNYYYIFSGRTIRLFGVLAWLAGVSTLQVEAQPNGGPWTKLAGAPKGRAAAEFWVNPQKFQPIALDHENMRAQLARTPMESFAGPMIAGTEIFLPMPDGAMQRFKIVESPVMAPELAAKFPEIKTYLGQGIDDPAASVRLDMTPAGFHAQILSPQGAVYIDPHLRDRSVYASYYKRDYRQVLGAFQCLVDPSPTTGNRPAAANELARSGGNLRTYRLAVAATGEYTTFHGGTVSAGLAAVVTAVNRLTGVYETEMAVRLVLVANNNLIIYTSSGSDPYSNANASSLLTQNQSNLDSVIGSANYDIGHVFSTAGGGLASLGVVCVNGAKARGETGLDSPIGDAFYIDFVAHEIGHQFGANHTFNSTTGNCSGNRNASTAYEVGSGSTIMAYAGICDTDDLQLHSDPYFHAESFDEILNFTTGGSGNSCAVISSTGNTAPTVNAGANYTIPASTPFMLTAVGSDPNGDPLTYCWEERDLGPSTTVTAADNASSPLFRSFNPTINAWRTFPKLSNILNGTTTVGEKLPTMSRTMNFRVTARDNRAGGGGVNTDDMNVTVASSAGPFQVTSHGGGGTFSNSTTVTWNVAGTTVVPISAANVNILLSTNGGQSFPIVLLANTPNDGSQSVTLPNLTTASARLKVEAAGNIFFDINSANFSIVPGIPAPLVSLDSTVVTAEQCPPGNGAIDPGETVTVSVALRNTGSANTTNLVVTLQPTGGVVSPSGPQNYGVMLAGGAIVSRNFTFTASGSCGGILGLTLQLQDGPANLGSVGSIRFLGGFATNQFAFTNAAAISIPASGNKGKAGPYPATISIAGVPGTVTKVTVTLAGLSHTFADDVDVLLVAPGGQSVMLLSDAGGSSVPSGQTLTFDDAAADAAPDGSALTSGSYWPTDYDTASDALPSPAPTGPFGGSLATLNGISPNGNWSLYIQDDSQQDSGSIAQGWRLNILTVTGNCCSGVATNNPPLLSPISQKAVNELQLLTFTNSASDPDGNTLTFSLGAGAPSNATVNAASGLFSWTPTEAQGPGTNLISVILTDNGTPSLSVTQTFTAIVNEINSAPSLSSISNKTVTEGFLLTFTNLASDADIPANVLTFSLGAGAPSNAAIHATSGVFSWTPTEGQGPGTNFISVILTDNGTPSLSVTQTFTAIVNEFNSAPSLSSISNKTVTESFLLTFTNSASDADTPANLLTFSLGAGAPSNATIHATSGLFSWTPTEAQGPGTNLIAVIATDNGTPSLSVTQSFTVFVLETNAAPALAAIAGRMVHAGTLLQFTSTATDSDLPADALIFSLQTGAPSAAVVNPTNGIFTWLTGNADAGTTNNITVIVTDNGSPNLNASWTFEAVVLPRPLIQSIVVSNSTVTVTWTAIAGQTYRLQTNANLDTPAWSDAVGNVIAGGSTASASETLDGPVKFFRVRVAP